MLLKGVNDDTDVMRDLVHGLGRMGVRPYYLYYADLVEGTGHFRTEVYKGKEICRDLCGATTGLPAARPTWSTRMGGRGKVPVDLGYSDGISEDRQGRDPHLGDRARQGLRERPDREDRRQAPRHNPNRK